MRKSLKITLVILALLAVLVGSFVIWGETPAAPMPEALAALNSDSQVEVTQGKWLIFQPEGIQADTAFILYPGGRVDYRAYAPAAHSLAAQGILTIIVHMPLNLAVMDPNAAGDVISTYPEILHWYIGGHSLGGSMAAYFIFNHPEQVEGLILWASYPASNNDLASANTRVLSISGSLDGLSTPEKIATSHALLPPDSVFVIIPGGNHAQFGWYGEQVGDNPASISRDNQQNEVIQATFDFINPY